MVRLRRSSPDTPGWTRRRAGKGFVYLDQDGERLGPGDVARVKGLVIPPAWQDVWICSWPNGHLQAVGTDDAGRRQYLYHPDWRVRRDGEKFRRMLVFGKALSKAREQVLVDLGAASMTQERACAVAVRLLDLRYFRIGNEEYAEENTSFGLTTLERRHVRRDGKALVFEFTGKSGIEHTITIDDAGAVEALEVMRRRRGGDDRLLAWKDGRRWRPVDSALVNEYVGLTTGMEATAKDFRTWHATVLMAVALAVSREVADSPGKRRRAVARAYHEVAEYLGNTPAVARASYVDPRIVDLYDGGSTVLRALEQAGSDGGEGPFLHGAVERAVLRLLST